jgi:hypothetical protein
MARVNIKKKRVIGNIPSFVFYIPDMIIKILTGLF